MEASHALFYLKQPNNRTSGCCGTTKYFITFDAMSCFTGGPQPLSWAVRLKVAIGAARGLSFLHDLKSQVIYRDFKASNILLDAVC